MQIGCYPGDQGCAAVKQVTAHGEVSRDDVVAARVHAKLLRPENAAAPHPVVVMFPGYTGSSADWLDRLNEVGMGWALEPKIKYAVPIFPLLSDYQCV